MVTRPFLSTHGHTHRNDKSPEFQKKSCNHSSPRAGTIECQVNQSEPKRPLINFSPPTFIVQVQYIPISIIVLYIDQTQKTCIILRHLTHILYASTSARALQDSYTGPHSTPRPYLELPKAQSRCCR